MKLKVLFALLALCVIFILPSTVSASPVYAKDRDGYLDENELAQLNSALSDATSRSGVPHYVYIRSRNGIDAVTEDEVLAEFSLDFNDDAVILAVDCYDYQNYYELFTYGEGYDLLSDSDCDLILDDAAVYTNIKSGKLLSGTERFAVLSASTVIESRESAETMKIVLPIIIGLASGAIAVACVVVSYKRKLKSPIYPLSRYASMKLTHSSDSYITSTVTRTRVQSSSGGSGGRSGGSRGRR